MLRMSLGAETDRSAMVVICAMRGWLASARVRCVNVGRIGLRRTAAHWCHPEHRDHARVASRYEPLAPMGCAGLRRVHAAGVSALGAGASGA